MKIFLCGIKFRMTCWCRYSITYKDTKDLIASILKVIWQKKSNTLNPLTLELLYIIHETNNGCICESMPQASCRESTITLSFIYIINAFNASSPVQFCMTPIPHNYLSVLMFRHMHLIKHKDITLFILYRHIKYDTINIAPKISIHTAA
jgi:hypothetical protein